MHPLQLHRLQRGNGHINQQKPKNKLFVSQW